MTKKVKYNVMVGRRMAALRKEKNLTQAELGKEIGYQRSHIANFESGNYPPGETAIKEYCRFFEVEPEYFQEYPLCKKTQALLGELYKNILNEDYPLCEPLLKRLSGNRLNFEQEIVYNGLSSAFFYGMRNETAAEEKGKVVSVFLNAVNYDFDDPVTLNKSQQLYQIERCRFDGKHQEAIDALLSLKELEPCKLAVLRIRLRICVSYFRKQDYYMCYELASVLIKDLEGENIPRLLSKSYVILASACSQLELFQKSNAVLEKLELLVKKNALIEDESILYSHRAYNLSQCGNKKAALENYKRSLRTVQGHERYVGTHIAVISNAIALENYTEANRSIQILEKESLNQREKMVLQSFKGEILLYQGDEKGYWRLQKKSLDFFLDYKLYHNVEYIYDRLIHYYQKNSSFTKAFKYQKIKEEIIRAKNSEKVNAS